MNKLQKIKRVLKIQMDGKNDYKAIVLLALHFQILLSKWYIEFFLHHVSICFQKKLKKKKREMDFLKSTNSFASNFLIGKDSIKGVGAPLLFVPSSKRKRSS